MTIVFKNTVGISGVGSIVGDKEAKGTFSEFWTHVASDSKMGKRTWEEAESEMAKHALMYALSDASLTSQDADIVFAGDLLNQCTAQSLAHRDLPGSYIGLYGACSTFTEAICLSAVFVESGFSRNAAACVSSHYCTAERQFRTPLEYGSQRTPTAQWTVTGAGCAIISSRGIPINSVTIGSIIDAGITDPNNMGAAMAPAAFETIFSHMKNRNTKPEDYDLIVTGDLGSVGRGLLEHLFSLEGTDLSEKLFDCGERIFKIKEQDAHAGGSGPACSASVFCAYIAQKLRSGELKRVLFCSTGALQSVLSLQQKESIPGICHAVDLGGVQS